MDAQVIGKARLEDAMVSGHMEQLQWLQCVLAACRHPGFQSPLLARPPTLRAAERQAASSFSAAAAALADAAARCCAFSSCTFTGTPAAAQHLRQYASASLASATTGASGSLYCGQRGGARRVGGSTHRRQDGASG